MSFDAAERSRFRGRPIDLFLFRYGPGPNSFYAYTNAEQVIQIEDVSYQPVPIERDSVKSNGTLDKSLLSIRVPKQIEVPELFRVYPPSSVVQVVITQAHYDYDEEVLIDPKVVWTGRVINAARAEQVATLSCEPIATSMRRSGLREHYQYGCRHVLYGPRCRAEKKRFPANVESLSGTTMTLRPGWNASGHDQSKFLGGLVEWDSIHNLEPRTILRRLDDNVFLLSGFLRELQPGMPVNMILGCPHDARGCETIHQNIQNYGGCLWIPFDSPFGKNPF